MTVPFANTCLGLVVRSDANGQRLGTTHYLARAQCLVWGMCATIWGPIDHSWKARETLTQETPRKRTRLWPSIRIAVLVLAILTLAYAAHTFYRTYKHALLLKSHLYALRAAGLDQPQSLGQHLDRVQGDVALIRSDLKVPLMVAPYLGWLPVVGHTVEAAPVLFSAGESLLQAVVATWHVLETPMIKALQDEDSLSIQALIIEVVQQIEDHRPTLEQVAEQVRFASQQLHQISAARVIPQLSGRLAQVQELTPFLTAAFDGLVLAPELIPAEGERTWLLLAQNSDELRATGGFISAMGTVSLIDGLPVLGPLTDSYKVENWKQPHPDPPEPLKEHMGLDLWATRDANWWPDFPTSAQAAADLYTLNQGGRVDGVIAIDTIAAARIVDLLTPLWLSDGRMISRGQAEEVFRESWTLPKGSLVTEGVVVTTTHPFADLEISLSYSDKRGRAWFDSVVVARQGQPDTNLVRNGSFEKDQNGDGIPDEWHPVGITTTDGLVSTFAHSGQASMLIGGGEGATKAITQHIEISGEAGEVFRLSAESRSEDTNVDGGPYALTATFIAEDGTVERFEATFPVLTHNWATAGSGEILGTWWRHRKDFMGHTIQSAAQKVLQEPSEVPWLDLALELRALLAKRHIQAYAAQPDLQALLASRGWSGELVDSPGDYLLVVDSNMGYNKVSDRIDQLITYEVELSGEQARSRLVLNYENLSEETQEPCDKFKQYVPTYEQLVEGCYWDYVRIYVPRGAELISSSGADEPISVYDELERTVLAAYFLVRPGERRTLQFEYLLPLYVLSESEYTLYLQKQAGTRGVPIEIHVSDPSGHLQHRAGPEPDRSSETMLEYRLTLVYDHELSIDY